MAVNTGAIDITISGDIGASILNLFTSFLKSTIKDTIVKQATSAIYDTVVPMANQALSTLPYDIAIPSTPFSVHWNPSAATSLDQGLMSQAVSAHTYITTSPSLPAIPDPVPLSPANPQNAFLRALLSDYAVNSIFYTVQ